MSKFYGQAWIEGDSLVQEVITFTQGSDNLTQVDVLVANIWDNLKGTAAGKIEPPVSIENTATGNDPAFLGYFQSPSNPKFFFWKIRQTPIDNGSDFYIAYPCPEPKGDTFEPPYNPSDYSDSTEPWAHYWVTKIKEADENYEKSATIQRNEVVFPGTSFIGQDGDEVTINDFTYINNDLGDISNLLRLF